MCDIPPEKIKHFEKIKEETGVLISTQIMMWKKGYIIKKVCWQWNLELLVIVLIVMGNLNLLMLSEHFHNKHSSTGVILVSNSLAQKET